MSFSYKRSMAALLVLAESSNGMNLNKGNYDTVESFNSSRMHILSNPSVTWRYTLS